ncbi:GNAT family N-acetyltransferase [Aspergillus novofumigatus IBT 16806]|uniref:Putative acetyltransferase, GNAT family n=1 Tax=Aspergillus novofumigatus (strain IBT 16806) TaxID=1392255 RepID=A0A2I1C1H4_ASPN1|nr:putative acetyltransferase, GNAT family [Aspergillus novofumigatus IBT 16806]PKX91431.1 putative acetyltransferase, GNAT family [Aspergillus novofumigatus IBT 16806]
MTINAQPTLHTARLELVPLGPEHREFTMKLDMDPEVMKMVAFGRPFTEDEAIQVHTWLMGCATSVPGFGTWAGFAKGEFVGWWILAPVPTKENPERFMTDRTEYGFRMVRYAFQELGLAEVIGETMTINMASRAVMAGCGLKHVETFFNKYDTPPPGIEEGEVRYSITREEWLRKEKSSMTRNRWFPVFASWPPRLLLSRLWSYFSSGLRS